MLVLPGAEQGFEGLTAGVAGTALGAPARPASSQARFSWHSRACGPFDNHHPKQVGESRFSKSLSSGVGDVKGLTPSESCRRVFRSSSPRLQVKPSWCWGSTGTLSITGKRRAAAAPVGGARRASSNQADVALSPQPGGMGLGAASLPAGRGQHCRLRGLRYLISTHLRQRKSPGRMTGVSSC